MHNEDFREKRQGWDDVAARIMMSCETRDVMSSNTVLFSGTPDLPTEV
jgi:hypothetical protein